MMNVGNKTVLSVVRLSSICKEKSLTTESSFLTSSKEDAKKLD